MSSGRRGRPWRRTCTIVYATTTRLINGKPQATCIICGDPIDMLLKYPNPMSKSVDHRTPLAQGGAPLDLANLGPAHLHCNTSKGARPATNHVRSREW